MNQQFFSIAFAPAPQEARQTSSPHAGQRPSSVRPSGPAVSPERARAVPGADQYQPPVPTTASYEHQAYMDYILAASVNYPCPDYLVYQMAASAMMGFPGGVYPEGQAPGDPSWIGVHSWLDSLQPSEELPPPGFHRPESKTVLATGLGGVAIPDEVKIWIRKRCGWYNVAPRDIRVPRKGPKIRGKAFVDFETQELALHAIKFLNHSTFGPRTVAAKLAIEGLPQKARRNRGQGPKKQSTNKGQDSSTDEEVVWVYILPKRPGIYALSDAGPETREDDDDDDLETQGQMEGEADKDKVAPKMFRRHSF